MVDLILSKRQISLHERWDSYWWTGVVWIIVMFFLWIIWTLIPMASIHYRGSIDEQVMQCWISPNEVMHCSKSVLMKKQSHLPLGWPEGKYNSTNSSSSPQCNTNLLRVFGTVEDETAWAASFCDAVLFGLLYHWGIHTRKLTIKSIGKIVQDAHTVFCGLESNNS